jgi:hypothetical protein
MFGLLVAAVTFLLARKLVLNSQWAAVAVWLLAFDQVNISMSVDPMLDVFMLFFALLGVYLILRSDSSRSFVLAGISFGLALASKWTSILVIVPMVVYVLYRPGFRKAGVRCLLGLASAAAVYCLCYLPLIVAEGFGSFVGLQFSMFSFVLHFHGTKSLSIGILTVLNRLAVFPFFSKYDSLYNLWPTHISGIYYLSFDQGVNPFTAVMIYPATYWQIRKYLVKGNGVRQLLIMIALSVLAWQVFFSDPFETWLYAPILTLTAIFISDLLRKFYTNHKVVTYVYLSLAAAWPAIASILLSSAH